MKKGAAWSLVWAPAGPAMFGVTHAVWARAAGTSHTADINVPVRTANMLFIFFSGVGESYGLVFTGSMASGRLAVNSNGTYVRFGRDRARSMNWRDTG